MYGNSHDVIDRAGAKEFAIVNIFCVSHAMFPR